MILVTGGAGMIGAHTAHSLAQLGRHVVVTVHQQVDMPPFLDARVDVELLDVTDRDAFLRLVDRYEITDIVHLAGSIPGEDTVRFFRDETVGLLNALDAARAGRVRRFLVASSLGVYAGCSETPWHEKLSLPAVRLPHLIVAFKKSLEPLVAHALQGSGIEPVLLRIGSTWGPLMDPNSPFNLIPPYISTALRGRPLPPLHAEDGGDTCYAPDTGRAIALLATTKALRHDTYNVSSGRPFTHGELADAVANAVDGAEPKVLPGRSPGAEANPYLDISRLVDDTGYTPAFDIAGAVADYVEWRQTHSR